MTHSFDTTGFAVGDRVDGGWSLGTITIVHPNGVIDVAWDKNAWDNPTGWGTLAVPDELTRIDA